MKKNIEDIRRKMAREKSFQAKHTDDDWACGETKQIEKYACELLNSRMHY